MSGASVADFLAGLRARDVKVWVDGDRLRINVPKGLLTPALRDEIAARKAEIIAFLAAEQAPAVADGAAASDRAPISFQQMRLWFLDQLHPGTAEYNIPGALRLFGALDAGALDRALTEIVRRHASLRTIFAAGDKEPVQIITPPSPATLQGRDVTGDDIETRLKALMLEEARRPFDLARGPLFRFTLFRVGDKDHVLMAVVHHIVCDGWSVGLFVRELMTLYEAYATGQPSPLPELPMQYGDFARWQRQSLAGSVLERGLGYWTRELKGHAGVLDLPTDRPRPPVQTFRGGLVRRSFAADLPKRLQDFSSQAGVTMFMSLLAAFMAVLSRYTSHEHLLVGTPVANRTRMETEGLIGFFANTVVIRADLSGEPTFLELLHRVRDVAIDAYGHQDVPFERIVEALQLPRDLSRPPLVQVMFTFQNFPSTNIELVGLTAQQMEFDRGLSRMDLTLESGLDQDGLKVVFEYNADLFDRETIEAMGRHLETLLDGAIADPHRPVAAVPILSDEERQRLLGDWNATEAEIPPAAGVHELVARQAARTPDAVAAVFGGERLTYRELDAAAQRVAQRLRAAGVRPGVIVGLCVERSLDMLVGLLGILKAGGAYLPLDPAFPAERLAFMLHDAGCPVLVTQERLRGGLPPNEARVITLDSWRDETAVLEPDGAASLATADDVAYVLYTSGSTGRPKGVQIPHRALVNLLVSFRRTPGLTEKDALLAVTTLSFDIAGLELFLPLTVGARVVVASRENALDSAALMRLLASERVTAMQATPATWRLLLDAGWRAPDGFTILCGGEALSEDLARRLVETGAAVWNVYGPTETTIWSTIHRITTVDGTVPVGRPIANTQLYVVDRRGDPVPPGVPGELLIGGAGVALGYLKRAELTAERFVPDRFRPEMGGRLYRTGDLVRYRRDGVVEFLGRLDDQVKIRGFRVELGEIEAVLNRHPAVAHAVVTARDEPSAGKRLAAYLVPAGPSMPSIGDLRAFVAVDLPDYMVPSTFTVLPSLPLTPNGKVDRRRLPAPDVQREHQARFEAPRSEIERAVSGVWRSVLGVEDVGVTDNFFDLGGHSLLVVQVHAKLRDLLDHDLSIIEMFQFPTVRSLSERLAKRSATSTPGGAR